MAQRTVVLKAAAVVLEGLAAVALADRVTALAAVVVATEADGVVFTATLDKLHRALAVSLVLADGALGWHTQVPPVMTTDLLRLRRYKN
jgi:hypothetical protein